MILRKLSVAFIAALMMVAAGATNKAEAVTVLTICNNAPVTVCVIVFDKLGLPFGPYYCPPFTYCTFLVPICPPNCIIGATVNGGPFVPANTTVAPYLPDIDSVTLEGGGQDFMLTAF